MVSFSYRLLVRHMFISGLVGPHAYAGNYVRSAPGHLPHQLPDSIVTPSIRLSPTNSRKRLDRREKAEKTRFGRIESIDRHRR